MSNVPAQERPTVLLAFAHAKLDEADMADDSDGALAEAAFAIVAVLDLAEGVTA